MIPTQHLAQVDACPIDVDGQRLVGEGEVRNRDEPPAGLNRELLLGGEPGALQKQKATVFKWTAYPRLERGPQRSRLWPLARFTHEEAGRPMDVMGGI